MRSGAPEIARRAATIGAVRSRLAAGAAMVLTLTACGGDGGGSAAAPTTAVVPTSTAPTPAPTSSVPTAPVQTVAVAKGSTVEVFASPVQPEPAKVLDNPQPSGAAPGGFFDLRMLVVEQREGWVKVLLPLRPNGSNGWVRRSAVDLETHDYRAVVELGAHRITVWKGNDVVLAEPVGVGASGRTPTTKGLFYTTELYPVLPSQQAAYGPWAFALSGFSEVLQSFGEGGTGVLGLHGTGDPSSIGRDVSNGCIRMSNSGITKLADMLPLGTPVEITA